MKKSIVVCILASIFSLFWGNLNFIEKAYAAENTKKAILVVSFGTTYADTRTATIDAVAEKIKMAYPEYDVRQAYTSRIIIKRLADRDGIKMDTEKQALEKLKNEGYREVIVQPLHIEPGDEYEKVSRIVEQYADNKVFDKIVLSRSLLYFMGQEGRPDDYAEAISAVQKQLPKMEKHTAVVLMGHGGPHPSNAAYATLQLKLQDAGMNNMFVYTVEGYPDFEQLVEKLKANKFKKVVLMPFMVVAGDHASNDMAGDEKDSAKSQLKAAGFEVEVYLHGLGENPAIQNIYVQHVKDAMEGKYDKSKRGKDRPEIPVID